MQISTQVNFVVALSPEAKPVISYYKLKRIHSISAFEVYKNENKQLIISGIGKTNSAVATAYLAGLTDVGSTQLWINAGIAGGTIASIGSAVLANSILDQATGKYYFPTLCFNVDLPQSLVTTVNQPVETYGDGSLYDMEAAGFFVAASRFSTTELVHSFKIVSDNNELGVNSITRESTVALMEARISELDRLTQVMLALAGQITPDYEVEALISLLMGQYHFTTVQQHILRTLLHNWFSITRNSDVSLIKLIDAKNSGEFIQALEDRIKSLPVKY